MKSVKTVVHAVAAALAEIDVMAHQHVGPLVVAVLVTVRVQLATVRASVHLAVMDLQDKAAARVVMDLQGKEVAHVGMVLLDHVVTDLQGRVAAHVASVTAIVKIHARSVNGWRCPVIFR